MDEMIKEPVSKRLLRAMERAGINQVELAKRIGVTHGTISQYLSDTIVPRQNRIAAMAKVLGVSPAWLWGFDVEMTEEEQKKRQAKIDYIVSLPDDKLDILIEIAERLK